MQPARVKRFMQRPQFENRNSVDVRDLTPAASSRSAASRSGPASHGATPKAELPTSSKALPRPVTVVGDAAFAEPHSTYPSYWYYRSCPSYSLAFAFSTLNTPPCPHHPARLPVAFHVSSQRRTIHDRALGRDALPQRGRDTGPPQGNRSRQRTLDPNGLLPSQAVPCPRIDPDRARSTRLGLDLPCPTARRRH
jgi:hypothetical protein